MERPPLRQERATRDAGSAARAGAWQSAGLAALAGRHKLELLDASGKVLDSIALEVRGAGALVAGPEQIQSQRRR
jgi:penicillin-binding protein 1C